MQARVTADRACRADAPGSQLLVPPPPRASPRECESGTCVAGAGLDIGEFVPYNDLYKTIAGVVEIGEVASWLVGLDYATFDRYPTDGISIGPSDSGDTRTNERISAVRSEDQDNVQIAVSTPGAANGGWELLGTADAADFRLIVDSTTDDANYDYWLYQHAMVPGEWVPMPAYNATAEEPAFVFANAGTLTFANPLMLPSGTEIFGSELVSNVNICLVPGARPAPA